MYSYSKAQKKKKKTSKIHKYWQLYSSTLNIKYYEYKKKKYKFVKILSKRSNLVICKDQFNITSHNVLTPFFMTRRARDQRSTYCEIVFLFQRLWGSLIILILWHRLLGKYASFFKFDQNCMRCLDQSKACNSCLLIQNKIRLGVKHHYQLYVSIASNLGNWTFCLK